LTQIVQPQNIDALFNWSAQCLCLLHVEIAYWIYLNRCSDLAFLGQHAVLRKESNNLGKGYNKSTGNVTCRLVY